MSNNSSRYLVGAGTTGGWVVGAEGGGADSSASASAAAASDYAASNCTQHHQNEPDQPALCPAVNTACHHELLEKAPGRPDIR